MDQDSDQCQDLAATDVDITIGCHASNNRKLLDHLRNRQTFQEKHCNNITKKTGNRYTNNFYKL